jgi:hypothetical protein
VTSVSLWWWVRVPGGTSSSVTSSQGKALYFPWRRLQCWEPHPSSSWFHPLSLVTRNPVLDGHPQAAELQASDVRCPCKISMIGWHWGASHSFLVVSVIPKILTSLHGQCFDSSPKRVAQIWEWQWRSCKVPGKGRQDRLGMLLASLQVHSHCRGGSRSSCSHNEFCTICSLPPGSGKEGLFVTPG